MNLILFSGSLEHISQRGLISPDLKSFLDRVSFPWKKSFPHILIFDSSSSTGNKYSLQPMLCSATSHTVLCMILPPRDTQCAVVDSFNLFSPDLLPSRFPQAGSYLLLDAITFPLHHPQAEVTVLGGYFRCMSQEFPQLHTDLQSYKGFYRIFLQQLKFVFQLLPYPHAV